LAGVEAIPPRLPILAQWTEIAFRMEARYAKPLGMASLNLSLNLGLHCWDGREVDQKPIRIAAA